MSSDILTRPQLAAAFAEIGLEAGDRVLVHSSFKSLGSVEGGPQAVIDALLDALGPEGSLVVPTFNYSVPVPEPHFDPAETPGRTGIISEMARKRAEAVRSLHPTHSVSVIGREAEALTRGHLATRTFGLGSPLDRLAARGGKVLLLGVGHTSNSTIHVAEEHADLPKGSWYDTLPVAKVLLPDGSFTTHPFDTSPSCSVAFGGAEGVLRRHDAIRDRNVRGSRWQLMRGADIITYVAAMILEKPDILLCTRPDCKPCTEARRNLRAEGRL